MATGKWKISLKSVFELLRAKIVCNYSLPNGCSVFPVGMATCVIINENAFIGCIGFGVFAKPSLIRAFSAYELKNYYTPSFGDEPAEFGGFSPYVFAKSATAPGCKTLFISIKLTYVIHMHLQL